MGLMVARLRISLALLAVVAILVGCMGARDDRLAVEGWTVSQARVSPDGTSVAVLATPTSDKPLGLLDSFWPHLIVTGNPVTVLDGAGRTTSAFDWLPDSTRLLIAHRDWSGHENGDTLEIVDVTGQQRQVVAAQTGLDVYGGGMSVSPDGKTAILSAQPFGPQTEPSDLYLLDLEDASITQMTYTTGTSERYPVHADHQRLVFVGSDVSGQPQGANGWVGMLDLESGAVRQLTGDLEVVESAVPVGPGYVVYKMWSRDPVTEAEHSLRWISVDDPTQNGLLEPGPLRFPWPAGDQLLVVDSFRAPSLRWIDLSSPPWRE